MEIVKERTFNGACQLKIGDDFIFRNVGLKLESALPKRMNIYAQIHFIWIILCSTQRVVILVFSYYGLLMYLAAVHASVSDLLGLVGVNRVS